MRVQKRIGILTAIVLGMLSPDATLSADDHSADLRRIQNAQKVFHELMKIPDHAIPHELLESAKCIAIVPGEKKAGFIVAAEYGKGLAMCRTEHGWSGPVFLTIAGGGFGPQIGGASTDVVMIFRNSVAARQMRDVRRLCPNARLSTNCICPGSRSKSTENPSSSKTSSMAAIAAAPSSSTGSPFIA